MAVNKAMLVNLLMNSAPILLSTLQKPYYAPAKFYHGDDPLSDTYENIGNLNNVASRGYDMGIIEDDMLKNFNSPHFSDDWAMVDSAQYALSKTAQAANRANSPKTIKFPSDTSGWGKIINSADTSPLDDYIYEYIKSTAPAAASATVFKQPRGVKALAQNLLGKVKNEPF